MLPQNGKLRHIVSVLDFPDGLPRAVRSQPVAGITHDAPLLEQKHAGIARPRMDHKHLFLAESRILGQSLLHLHVNEARHLAVVNAAPPQAVGHVHAVHEHVHIIRLGNDVGNHEPDGKLAAGSVFLENFQIVADDLHAAVHGMPGNAVEPENVTRHRNGLLKEIQQANPVPDSLSHHQAHGARAQIDHRLS